MKKLTPLLFVLLTIGLSCRKEKPVVQNPVTKKISFSIGTTRDYSDHFYDNAFAEVYLLIYKNCKKNGTGSIVWDTTYHFRQYKQYPSLPEQISFDKEVPVIESNEQLTVSSVRRHIVNGYQSTATRTDTVKTNSLQVSVNF